MEPFSQFRWVVLGANVKKHARFGRSVEQHDASFFIRMPVCSETLWVVVVAVFSGPTEEGDNWFRYPRFGEENTSLICLML
jgi:hypothetical protein